MTNLCRNPSILFLATVLVIVVLKNVEILAHQLPANCVLLRGLKQTHSKSVPSKYQTANILFLQLYMYSLFSLSVSPHSSMLLWLSGTGESGGSSRSSTCSDESLLSLEGAATSAFSAFFLSCFGSALGEAFTPSPCSSSLIGQNKSRNTRKSLHFPELKNSII